MSGTNPFRRRLDQGSPKAGATVTNPAFEDRAESRVSPIDTNVHRPPKTKTGKTVRIISPYSTTSDDSNGMSQSLSLPPREITSLPPPSTISSESSDDEFLEDPFSTASDRTAGSGDDEGARENTPKNRGASQSGASRTSDVPANPFAKTFAGPSTEERQYSPKPATNPIEPELEVKNSRPRYDVDEFKKLLLTGEKSSSRISPSGAPPVSFQGQHNSGDTSSNTDASSISRQSIFESVTATSQESPLTSHEGSPLDDDRQQLVGQPFSSHKSKPSTPRHRHGKLVKTNAPLTVSFEDPSLSFSSSPNASNSPETRGDADKPLPPLPQNPLSSGWIRNEENLKPESKQPTNIQPPSPTTQKHFPPVPPISQRHSQLKQKPYPIPEQATSVTDELTTESKELFQSPSNTTSKVPPPPPPRRSAGLVRLNSSSSASTGASVPPMQPQSSAEDSAFNPSKARPPALPNHSPNLSSVKRQSNQAIPPSSPAVAPPPPPRRRCSSQSSYTPSRLSGDYRTTAGERLRSDSGASSISHLQMTPMTATPSSTESKDIMADLSALQREVDELRGKFKD